jgi:hypothetical protein
VIRITLLFAPQSRVQRTAPDERPAIALIREANPKVLIKILRPFYENLFCVPGDNIMLTTEPGLARNFLNIAFAGFGVLVTVLIAVALG